MIAIEFKRGVDTVGLTPQVVLALSTALAVFGQHQKAPMVITSGTDGTHKRQSAHYSGRAVDIRIWNLVHNFDGSESHKLIAAEKAKTIAQEISSLLGENFDCIAEGDHIHLEWDPK